MAQDVVRRHGRRFRDVGRVDQEQFGLASIDGALFLSLTCSELALNLIVSQVKRLTQTLSEHIADSKLDEEHANQVRHPFAHFSVRPSLIKSLRYAGAVSSSFSGSPDCRGECDSPPRPANSANEGLQLDFAQIVQSELAKAGFKESLDNIKALFESVEEVKTCLGDDSLVAKTHYESLRAELVEVDKVVRIFPSKVSEIVSSVSFHEGLRDFIGSELVKSLGSKRGLDVLRKPVLAAMAPALERIDTRIVHVQTYVQSVPFLVRSY